MNDELSKKGFKNLVNWTRGVDRSLFRVKQYPLNKKLVIIYVGRISVEKNIEAFLNLEIFATKIVVGDGPEKERLEKLYPDATWLGALTGEDLVDAYNSANVFVFPSKTDTFGLVNIEALCCGLPIAAYPVTGPKDIVIQGKNGYLDENLLFAVLQCTSINKKDIEETSKQYTWERCANIFLETLTKE
jgi:glycosyltransferase involved in cell wall biosynthesis